MGPTYAPGLTIERKDVNGNCDPENCCWATMAEQQLNRRNARIVDTPQGRMNITTASRLYGVGVATLKARIRLGGSLERIFRPVQPPGRPSKQELTFARDAALFRVITEFRSPAPGGAFKLLTGIIKRIRPTTPHLILTGILPTPPRRERREMGKLNPPPTEWSEELFNRVFGRQHKSCQIALRSLWTRDQRVGAYQGLAYLEGVVANIPVNLEIHHFEEPAGELAVHGTPEPSVGVQLYDPEGTLTAALRQAFMGGALVSVRLTLQEPVAFAAITGLSREHPVVWATVEHVHFDELYGAGPEQPANPLQPLRAEIAAVRREAKLAAGLVEYLCYGAGAALIFYVADQIAPQIEKSIGWDLRWGLWAVGLTAFGFYFDRLKRRILRGV
jgi:hypothetical protein